MKTVPYVLRVDARVQSWLDSMMKAVSDGRLDDAEGYERLALQTAEEVTNDPSEEHAEVSFWSGKRLMAEKQYPQAEQAFVYALNVRQQLVGQDLHVFEILQALGALADARGDYKEAARRFEQAVAVSVTLFGGQSLHAMPTRVRMAYALMCERRYPEATTALDTAKSLCENAGVAGKRQLAMVNEAIATLRRVTQQLAAATTSQGPTAEAAAACGPRPSGGGTAPTAANLSEPVAHDAHAADPAGTRSSARSDPGIAQELDIITGPPQRESVEDILAEMDRQLIGLAEVKHKFRRMADLLLVEAERGAVGLKTKRQRMHVLLIGPAGTGKTTLASYLGRLCFALELLDSGDVVTVTRGKIVQTHIGETAVRVNRIVDFCLEKVLFIDEAYALAKEDDSRDFGAEAIDELLVRMVADGDRFVLACAGYAPEMKAFLESNTGFASRFSEQFDFVNYQPAELLAIFELIVADNDYDLTDDARKKVLQVCEELYASADAYFGNGRVMENLFSDTIQAQASRLVESGHTDNVDALRRIEAADIVAPA